ncbi:550_t:CDS:10 [Entrophospora sp. SA101]|nr:13105_t:CDS:10 [Entrophospora sp. SA101]CAJ0837507.1 550_t:CDS:10 [Entrophospora sp. SA101]
MHRTPSSSSSQYSSSPPTLNFNNPSNQSNQTTVSRQITKTEQIVQNFYTKVAQILTQARLTEYDSQSSGKGLNALNLGLHPRHAQQTRKTNKWFNLELLDSDIYKEDVKYWRHTAISSSGSLVDPMIIEFFLDTSSLTKDQVLALTTENVKRKVRMNILSNNSNETDNKITKNIILERWQLSLKSLYAYVRLLPVYKLFRKIKKLKLNNSLKIGYRFVSSNSEMKDDIGIGESIVEGDLLPTASEFRFVQYRTNCEFDIDETESMISLDFLDMEENYFTPTMAYYYQQEEQRQLDKQDQDENILTKINRMSYLGTSPQYLNSLLGTTPPSVQSLSPSRSNPQLRESNADLSFSKNYSSSTHLSTSFGSSSNNTPPTLFVRTPDSRRISEQFAASPTTYRNGQRDTLFPSGSSISTATRPNVTLVQPFKKSQSLSSSPSSQIDINIPSPTFPDRISSSPTNRSPSQISLQQRNTYTTPTGRPLSIGSIPMPLSSPVKSNSSFGSPVGIPKFSPSFSNRSDKGGSLKDRDNINGSRRRSKSSLTNRSDGSASDRGSINSSFFASLEPDDDVGEFVRMVDEREPLKIFNGSSTGTDEQGGSGNTMPNSVYRSKLQLSRFQKLKESHHTLSESLTLETNPEQSNSLAPLDHSNLSSLSLSPTSKSLSNLGME